MRKLFLFSTFLLLSLSLSSAFQCEPLKQNGPQDEKIDVLLVAGEEYDSAPTIEQDFSYYTSTDNRGLFDVYPMNITSQRFNIWYVEGRDGSSTTTGNKGPFREAKYWRQKCGLEYSVFMSKDQHENWRAAALRKVARVDGVNSKVDEDNGAVGLIHEWGHLFGKVADEYTYGKGKRPSSSPNCANNMSQAVKWWGDMAEISPQVGFEKGCKGSENIEPHIGKSIMGDGGLWNYGPVNDRKFLEKISEKTGPVTNIRIKDHKVGKKKINLTITWQKASHVVQIKVNNKKRKKILAHRNGTQKIQLSKPEADNYNISIDTIKDIEETSDQDNTIQIGNKTSNTTKEPKKKNTNRKERLWTIFKHLLLLISILLVLIVSYNN